MENQLCPVSISETVVHMKEVWCISKCVLGFSFNFCSLGIVVVILWGEKVSLPKVGYGVLTCIILVFEGLWETFCTFLSAGKDSNGPEFLVTVLWSSTLGSRVSLVRHSSNLNSGLHFNLINTFTYWWSCFGTLFFGQSMYLLSDYRL